MFCISEVISPFKSLRAGSHVFSLLMLFLCVFRELCTVSFLVVGESPPVLL